MERGTLSLSPDPILATHEFRCFEGQGKRRGGPSRINNDTRKISTESQDAGGIAVPTWQFKMERLRVFLYFKFDRWTWKSFPAWWDFWLITTNRSYFIEPFNNYRGAATRARMKSLVILAQASSSRRAMGVEKSCEGRFNAVWSSNVSNYIHA